MIRSVLSGLWVCAISIVAVHVGATWPGGPAEGEIKPEPQIKALSQFKVKPISVPIIVNGKIDGYLLAQFTYIAEASTIKKLQIRPDTFILDAGYKELYEGRDQYTARPVSGAWQKLASAIKATVNSRYGEEVLKDVLLEDSGYVPAGAARKGSDLNRSGDRAEAKKKDKHH